MSHDRVSRRPLASVGPSSNNNTAASFTSSIENSANLQNGRKVQTTDPVFPCLKRYRTGLFDDNDEPPGKRAAMDGKGKENACCNVTTKRALNTRKIDGNVEANAAINENSKPRNNKADTEATPKPVSPPLDLTNILLIADRSHLFSANHGVDNHHNNFWCATAYEQGASKVDPVHPGPYFVNFPRLSDRDRMELAYHTSVLADEMHSHPPDGFPSCACDRMSHAKRYAFCSRASATLGQAVRLFDAFMSLVKIDDHKNISCKQHALYPFYVRREFLSPSGISRLNYLIALTCYAIADRKGAVRGVDYCTLLEVWEDIAKPKKLPYFIPESHNIDTVRDLDLAIHRVLGAQIAFRATCSLAEDLIGPRAQNSKFHGKACNGRIWEVTAEVHLLIRLAGIYPEIGLVFKPSIQATAASELASPHNEQLTYNDEILQGSCGSTRRDLVNRCKLHLVKVFLKLYNGGVGSVENMDPRYAVMDKVDYDIAQWMASLSFGDNSHNFLARIMERYESYEKMHSLHKRPEFIRT